MRKELRQSRRKQLNYPVWIDLGDSSAPKNCTLSDVSSGGAKVTLSKDVKLPKYFHLLVAMNGVSRRFCEVVWRENLNVGIKFVKTELRPEATVEKPELVAV